MNCISTFYLDRVTQLKFRIFYLSIINSKSNLNRQLVLNLLSCESQVTSETLIKNFINTKSTKKVSNNIGFKKNQIIFVILPLVAYLAFSFLQNPFHQQLLSKSIGFSEILNVSPNFLFKFLILLSHTLADGFFVQFSKAILIIFI